MTSFYATGHKRNKQHFGGTKAAELSQIMLHRVRETVRESKRSDSIRSGQRALLETFKETQSRRFFFFFFLAIPIFVIWPKIQNKFPQSFLFT